LNTGTNSGAGYTIPKELSLEIIRAATLEYGAARRLFANYTFNGAGNTVDMLTGRRKVRRSLRLSLTSAS
jgi:predicted phage gp36 major capsid-like protein